ncbi:MAG: formate dehydrogenase subunit delta [Caldimonas sp.]
MDSDKLVHMANRIGEFFVAGPDRAEAIEGVATHIARYWEPRMRRQILALLGTPAAESMSPLVAEALTLNRQRLAPAA